MREYGDILRVGSEGLAEVVVFPGRSLIDLVSGDQIFRVLVFVQNFERAGEINTGDIILPDVSLVLFQIIAQIKNVIGGDNAFPREHINPVGNRASVCQGRGFAPNHLLQIAQATREHVRRRRKPGCFRCA